MCVALQGTGKDLIQPVLDNQLKASSPLVIPPEVSNAHFFPGTEYIDSVLAQQHDHGGPLAPVGTVMRQDG